MHIKMAILLLVAGNVLAGPVRQQQSFDRDWRFHLGDVETGYSVGLDDTAWRKLDLPHDWSVEGSFSPDHASGSGYLPGGTGWYRKTFTLPNALQGSRVVIEFDGIYRNSDVWLNGTHLGSRPYGYIAFQYELTAYLKFDGQPNVLAVRVARENVADSRWYTGTGIYRHVWLHTMQPVHIGPWGVFVTTPRVTTEFADIVVTTDVVNGSDAEQQIKVVSQVIGPDGAAQGEAANTNILSPGQTYTFSDWQKIKAPQCWGPDHPVLYSLVSRVYAQGILVDEIRTPFGIRTFYFDPNRGFFLNGVNRKLKGLCLHHDGGVVGAAVPDDVLKRRLELVKASGANAVRCAHNPMAAEFYRFCDQIGLLVMDEAFDEWEIGKRKWVEGRNRGKATAERFGYSTWFAEWAERDCADMVRRARNHPSIIMWSIGNEIDYPTDPYVHPESRVDSDFADFSMENNPSVTLLNVVAPRLIAAVKRFDNTRPVTMALANAPASNGTGLADMIDIAGFNYQENHYQETHARFPNRVIYGSENGKNANQWLVVKNNDYICGQFLWTGIDYLGEAGQFPRVGSSSGIYDRCGFLKPAGYLRQALWTEAPMVYIHPRSAWRGRAANVTVYSNGDEVELRHNDTSLGRKPIGERAEAVWDTQFTDGQLTAIGFRKGQEAARHTLHTPGRPIRLEAESDRVTLAANGTDVAHIVLRVTDAHGHRAIQADKPVTVVVKGPGRLLGLDNGDGNDSTDLSSPTRKPMAGRLLALIQAGHTAGTLTVEATAPGIEPIQLVMKVKDTP